MDEAAPAEPAVVEGDEEAAAPAALAALAAAAMPAAAPAAPAAAAPVYGGAEQSSGQVTSTSDYTSTLPWPAQEMGGFDPDAFVQTPVDEQFICPVCRMVVRNPMLVVSCGHHFCHPCITLALKSNEICPLDRGPLSWQVPGALVPNRDMKRRVGQLEVFCEMKEHGCTWTGTLCSYDSHISSRQCKVKCPTTPSCGEVIPREELEAHDKVCPNVTVKCPFQYVGTGCVHECIRADLDQHCQQQSMQHNLMMVQSIDMLTNRLWQVAGSPVEERRTVHIHIFDKISRRLRYGRPFYSDAFYIGPCDSGYRLRMKIDPSDSQLGLSFYYALVKGKNDERLEWPFRRTVIVQCMHVTEDRVIVEQTVRPPSEVEKSRKYTSRPTENNNRRGWGRKGILSRDKQAEAGVLASDCMRVRYIVPWEPYHGPGAASTAQ
ncbi:TNF receptor-associated factor 4-like [Sycon ciliatum]|uniref:TNF receptor-associated factor 4-like n=1 Tax=Sycon ciliatum TaxID=27933 RepID=UPI0031F6A081